MKMKKWGVLAVSAAMVAALGLFGCSGGNDAKPADDKKAEEPKTEAPAEVTLMKDGTLTIVSSPDYPPFENLENGEIVGFEVDLFNAIADKMGLELEIVPLQFDAIIPAIAAGGQGDVGVSGFSVDPDRAKEIDFTESFYIDDQAVAVMDSSSITEDNAAEALNQADVIIAVQTGTTGETFAQENFPNATIQGYGNSTDCFAAMQSGNATAVCTNLAVVNRMLKDAYSDARVVLEIATGEEYAAVVSQDNPELTKQLNEAIKALKDDGTLEELTQKWF
ncbi:ABC transporter substrate-binding protein [Adlercreutzia faecimuris]|uniref:ABC transporter substrate-binding protein n=1 Tax=Adlercreutzia faecimuris TaxID=2897341 RepID=A0ABS9WEB3_9ACTN|nr:ABC transporter substrate-binding protein [Adlercreutzia sp. JBNU-10]MCI2241208.1 ABC transporter substrate-binding protein [Adlercreutzia sp. JBNU-10]